MGNAKPWQIILIVAGLLASGFVVWRVAFSGGPNLPNSVTLVDVDTGSLFVVGMGGRNKPYFPAAHPDTGRKTLLPVVKGEDGTWRITGHSLPGLEYVDGEAPAVVDRSTGAVNVTSESKRRLSL